MGFGIVSEIGRWTIGFQIIIPHLPLQKARGVRLEKKQRHSTGPHPHQRIS